MGAPLQRAGRLLLNRTTAWQQESTPCCGPSATHPHPAVTQRDLQAQALATAHVHEGNIDEACRIGSDALALADRQQVTTNLQDVCRLRLDLEPWRDTQAVRELDEQLAAIGGAR